MSTELDEHRTGHDASWSDLAPGLFRSPRTYTEVVFDPRPKLASIFEDSVLFDFVCDRSALIHLLGQASGVPLSAIETEVDLHVLRQYDQAEFIGTKSPREARSIAGSYKHHRAQMVLALAQAIDRYSKHALSKQSHHLALGPNIDRFRKECGWTFDVLSERTGLDRRLILSHVREGKGARPKTLKAYAEAFSRELKRTISVTDLHRFPSD